MLMQYIHRTGKEYYYAKLLTAFVGSFAVMAIPFLIDLILNYVTFPHNYHAPVLYDQDLTGENVMRETAFGAKPFANLFTHSLLAYNLLYLGFFSLLSGLTGMFAMAFSFLVHRLKILIFAPLFFLFQAGIYVNSVVFNAESLPYVNTNILSYVATDSFYGQSPFFIACVVLAILVFVLIACNRAVRREDTL